MVRVVRTVRYIGMLIGAFYIAGSIIDYPYNHGHIAAFVGGVLLVLPWWTFEEKSFWWPAYIFMTVAVLAASVIMIKESVSNESASLFGVIWILAILLQPIVVYLMKRESEQIDGQISSESALSDELSS